MAIAEARSNSLEMKDSHKLHKLTELFLQLFKLTNYFFLDLYILLFFIVLKQKTLCERNTPLVVSNHRPPLIIQRKSTKGRTDSHLRIPGCQNKLTNAIDEHLLSRPSIAVFARTNPFLIIQLPRLTAALSKNMLIIFFEI